MPEDTETRQRLLLALERVRRNISRVRDRKEHIGETQTKTSLIDPVLVSLGWDTTDIDEVSMEYRHKPKDNPVDYSLFVRRSACLFVEAKALDTNLDDHKWKSQVVNYANAAGVEWCVLSDGDCYCIYNSHAPVDVEQKLFRSIRISDTAQAQFALDTLALLSKEKLSDNILRDLWKAHFIDRSVQNVLETLFSNQDNGLVNLVRKGTPELKPAEIRESLKRAEIRIVFPALQTPLSHSDPDISAPSEPHTDTVPFVKVSDLISAGIVQPGSRWRFQTLQVTGELEVQDDGSLICNGERYTSPSSAGKAVTGWKSFDGWRLWQYQDAKGNWRSVDELRRLLPEASPSASLGETAETQTTQRTFTPEDHLAGKVETTAIFNTLLERTREAVGEFPVHANSKHIVFTAGSAFLVISALQKGLRIGLRLSTNEVDSHPRLKAQPNGVYEGWSALHVSTTLFEESQVDDELISLIKSAHRATA